MYLLNVDFLIIFVTIYLLTRYTDFLNTYININIIKYKINSTECGRSELTTNLNGLPIIQIIIVSVME